MPLHLGLSRSSTTLLGLAFLLAGLLPGVRWRAWVATFAWLCGFEGTWLLTMSVTHVLPDRVAWAALVLSFGVHWLALSFGWMLAAHVLGIRVSWRWAAVTALLWAGWIAFGFHSNGGDETTFSLRDEVLNEAAKTAWGLAYLTPLVMGGIRRLREARQDVGFARPSLAGPTVKVQAGSPSRTR